MEVNIQEQKTHHHVYTHHHAYTHHHVHKNRHTHNTAVPEKIEGMPLTDVRLVNIKLLTLAELKLITDKGAEGRKRLSELFSGPSRLVSTTNRESVL